MNFSKILLTIALIFAISLYSCKKDDTVIDPNLKKGWYEQLSGTSNNLQDVFFIDENEGWILGEKNILHTINGGINWNIFNTNAQIESFSTIYFQTNKIGWITGSQVSKTTDGGETWTTVMKNVKVNKVKFFDANNGYLIGKSFYKTIDGGVNWIELMDTLYDLPLMKDGNNGVVIDNNNLLGFYWADGMYKSIDGGATWATYTSTTEGGNFYYLKSIQFLDLNTGFYGDYSGIYKTTNGGLNWTIVYTTLPSSYQPEFKKLFFINKYISWALAHIEDNIILYTSDGGKTWTLQKFNTKEDLNSIFFINAKKGWVVGNNGTILHTDTGGIE